jgi:hypothetical protein
VLLALYTPALCLEPPTENPLNFKFTTKRALIFIAGLFGSTAIAQWLDTPLLAVGLMFAVIYYIKNET